MHCPNDETTLQMTSRAGIEIDYCPTCRGVWLDRGELDKLIAREGEGNAAAPQGEHYGRQDGTPARAYRDDDDDNEHYGRQGHEGDHKRKKKEGFLGDLFDF
ncbi:MAG TPA: zf-TFIIB domain-containing protein [Candidatus Saccharimonadales bacterium]|nr:zf-TFIIB domain-containing protein [Candidatus Saccharimonadales bacterium]